jgi:hypothetical protein
VSLRRIKLLPAHLIDRLVDFRLQPRRHSVLAFRQASYGLGIRCI